MSVPVAPGLSFPRQVSCVSSGIGGNHRTSLTPAKAPNPRRRREPRTVARGCSRGSEDRETGEVDPEGSSVLHPGPLRGDVLGSLRYAGESELETGPSATLGVRRSFLLTSQAAGIGWREESSRRETTAGRVARTEDGPHGKEPEVGARLGLRPRLPVDGGGRRETQGCPCPLRPLMTVLDPWSPDLRPAVHTLGESVPRRPTTSPQIRLSANLSQSEYPPVERQEGGFRRRDSSSRSLRCVRSPLIRHSDWVRLSQVRGDNRRRL